jgi:LytS/YehU family sensor histidine kinase
LECINLLQSLSLLPLTILITSIYLVLLLIPLSLAIAVLRYRLWDVDVLINKTLVYSMLTGILAAVYVGCIIGLQALFREIVKQNSDVAIVVSTLLIAALFQPLRKRIQVVIDRNFYRRRYDATRTLAAFSTVLRREVDLNQLSEQLVTIVQETMQPAHISLLLRHPEPFRERNTRRLPLIDVEEYDDSTISDKN